MNLKISCPLIAASRKKNATPTSMITLQKMIGMETSYLNNNGWDGGIVNQENQNAWNVKKISQSCL